MDDHINIRRRADGWDFLYFLLSEFVSKKVSSTKIRSFVTYFIKKASLAYHSVSSSSSRQQLAESVLRQV